MDSDNKQIKDMSFAIDELFIKVDQLKTKLDKLCKKTDGCGKLNKKTFKKKENINAININTLREEE